MPLKPRKNLVDRSKDANRFVKLSPQNRPVMPPGYEAEIEIKPSVQRMREQRERGVIF